MRQHGHQPVSSLVSIHAPAWGATTAVARCHDDRCLFQSTPPHGGRQSTMLESLPSDAFQSTPPHGGRLSIASQMSIGTLFQSTPPHGGRPIIDRYDAGSRLFQSTPPHGGRQVIMATHHVEQFQSTPPHGGRRSASASIHDGICFNPRPRMGGDLITWYTRSRFTCFNPRPRMGGDILHLATG